VGPAIRPTSGGAFYAFSPARVKSSIDLWKTQLSGIQPYYAVKCNPEPLLLNRLYDAGVNFDCASERELLAVKELARGTLPDRVLYANPTKSQRDLAAAAEMGGPTTVVDSVEELEKLKDYKGGALVRIAVDDTASAMPFSTKFGCSVEDVPRIGDAAKALRIPLHGVSFHVGSGCADGGAYVGAVRAAYQSILNLRRAGHGGAAVLNLGGGYLPDEVDFRRKAMAIRGVKMEIDAAEADRRGGPIPAPGIRWVAEPGRFFATGAFDFFVQVIGKKGGPKGWKYTIDDSLYGQFSSILFDYATPTWWRVPMAKKEKGRATAPGVLFGRTCDSVDVIARAEAMEELEVGDWLWFPNMGAYTRATASEFNGFPRPPAIEAAELPVDLDRPALGSEFLYSVPRGVTRMPPVSARAFWAATAVPGKN
jgi:ornithine decarboxylase